MRSAKISELKAHLSEYLAEVRRGATMVVCDRNTPIAWLVPYDSRPEDFRIEEPVRPRGDLKRIRGARPRRPVDVVKLLRESRDQR
jgi:prevent-host-death family protein